MAAEWEKKGKGFNSFRHRDEAVEKLITLHFVQKIGTDGVQFNYRRNMGQGCKESIYDYHWLRFDSWPGNCGAIIASSVYDRDPRVVNYFIENCFQGASTYGYKMSTCVASIHTKYIPALLASSPKWRVGEHMVSNHAPATIGYLTYCSAKYIPFGDSVCEKCGRKFTTPVGLKVHQFRKGHK
jgi:hypothetical protein